MYEHEDLVHESYPKMAEALPVVSSPSTQPTQSAAGDAAKKWWELEQLRKRLGGK